MVFLLKRYSLLAFLLLGPFSCTGSGLISVGDGKDGGQTPPDKETRPECKPSDALEIPVISFPTQKDFVLTDERVAVSIEAKELGADADKIDYELWQMSKSAPIAKVWTAVSDIPSETTKIDLSMGRFQDGFSELGPWKRYAYRTRTVASGDACSIGQWSEFRQFRSDDGSERIFDDQVIREVKITIPDESYGPINDEALPPACVPHKRSYYPGTVEFDGTTYENVGLRVKGGCGSAQTLSGKPSFKINLSDYSTNGECPETRRASGLKRLTLNNQIQDATHLRERISYDFFEAVGVNVPRRAPVRVYVNGDFWGLYLNLESFDKRFLRRRFQGLAAEGMLYEGTYECDWTSGTLPNENGPDNCWSKKFSVHCSKPAEEGGAPYSYAPLIDFVHEIEGWSDDEFFEKINQRMDFKAFISHWAADGILNNGDSLIFNHNNFRIYHNPENNKWTSLPSGLDLSLTIFYNTNPWNPANYLAERCLEVQECKDAFGKRLKEMITIFENKNYQAMANTIRDQVRSIVEEDPRRYNSDFDSFDEAVNSTIDVINARPAYIREGLVDHGY